MILKRIISSIILIIFLSGCLEQKDAPPAAVAGTGEGFSGILSLNPDAFLYSPISFETSTLSTPSDPGVICEGGSCPARNLVAIKTKLEDVQRALCSEEGRTVQGRHLGISAISEEGYLQEEIEFSDSFWQGPIILVLTESSEELASVFISQERVDPTKDIAIILPGDGNRDGRVDGKDKVIWQQSFGSYVAEGDVDFDGDVDGNDFLLMQSRFSTTLYPDCATLEDE